MITLEKFVEKQLQLLNYEQLEQQKEQEIILSNASHSNLQKNGLALLNMSLSGTRTSLGGKQFQ